MRKLKKGNWPNWLSMPVRHKLFWCLDMVVVEKLYCLTAFDGKRRYLRNGLILKKSSRISTWEKSEVVPIYSFPY